MELVLSASFFPLLEDQHRYLVLCGGRGSGKSEFAARKIFFRCQVEGNHHFLVLRKVRKTCGVSVIRVFQALLQANGVAFDYNKADHSIRFKAQHGAPNELLFDGLDEPEKIKSIKGITGIWMEETTEFTLADFHTIDLSLREKGPSYLQIVMTFNPLEAEAPWLKDMFFNPAKPDPAACVHNSTLEDNPDPFMRAEYLKTLEALREQDPTLYEMWRLGKWAMPRGQVYRWDTQESPIKYDEIIYGLDFGYSVNPSALIKIYRRADEFWLEEIIYQSGLTNQALAAEMKRAGVGRYDAVYADAAEPKSIDEINEQEFTVKPCNKGPDSVRAGIDYLKAQKIHVVPSSTKIISEASKYKWREDKRGNPLPEPVKFDDHAMDAIRYAIVTHCSGRIERHFHFIPDI
jgi:phage terminase large subunit